MDKQNHQEMVRELLTRGLTAKFGALDPKPISQDLGGSFQRLDSMLRDPQSGQAAGTAAGREHPVPSAMAPGGRQVLPGSSPAGCAELLNRALHSWPQAGPCLGSAHCTLQTESIIYLKGAAPQFLASLESHPSWRGRVSQAVELCLHWLKESLYFIKQADRRISRHRHHIDGFNFPNLQMHPLCPRVAAGCGLMPSQSKNQAEFY